MKKLKGVKILSKNSQEKIKGGILPVFPHCNTHSDCPEGHICDGDLCIHGDL